MPRPLVASLLLTVTTMGAAVAAPGAAPKPVPPVPPPPPPVAALPKNFVVVPGSVSPDGAWQVLIPSLASQDANPPRCETRLVTVATGALLKALPGECFFQGQGQVKLAPRWSADSQTLLWQADNKWGNANLLVVAMKGNKVTKVTDLRKAIVGKALAAAKQAGPKQYALAKKGSAGLGAWYRDGIAVDVQPAAGAVLAWPLAFTVDLTSDWKCDHPKADRLGGLMSATLDAKGAWTYAPFTPGHAACGKNGVTCTFSDCD